MPEVDLYRKLARLVTYKESQIKLLVQKVVGPEEWIRIEKVFQRENHYAQTAGFRPIENSYEKAMWAFYELLESISLNKIEVMKLQVYEQIRQIEVKRDYNLE